MNEIQKSETYKKDCMNMILELEKEKFLQLQLVQECYKKMEDFHKKCNKKVSDYQYELHRVLLQCDDVDKNLKSNLERLYNNLPEFNISAYVIVSFIFTLISPILYELADREWTVFTFILPWIIMIFLFSLPRINKKKVYLKECERLRAEAEHQKELIREEAKSYNIDEFKHDIDEKIYAFNEKVNEEINIISCGIDETAKNLDTLYNMIGDFPKELRGDLGAVSAIVSYLNKVGECTHKYWRMALLDAERVVGLRKVDNRLSDFENRMVEFSAELQSEIEMMIEDYNEEINDIMDSYIEMNDDLQEKQISIERRYQRNVDKANTAALKYIGEYHIY